MNHAVKAKEFVQNKDRAKWHDQSLWFVRAKRDLAAKSVPEWEELREKASQIKSHSISNLATYLEQFETEATKHGTQIHWAEDAAELNSIVYGLLSKRGLHKTVKSKSMLTEECGLNEFLISKGIEVIDTDLGERIVQLREEAPSHIVLPAIHITKEEVGELFHERLGTAAGASDPSYLTEAARLHLRQAFLNAEAGITGVNFAVAESGGIVVCTNEGNADLTTSLPKLHIACMGLEKIVPRLSDLAVFTRLLARSATGQPITTYTSHFHGPRPDGELHVVILDNGRSEIMAQKKYIRSLNCIRCGACMNTCPVYRRSGGHSYGTTVPGPIGSILAPVRDPQSHRSLPFACTMCGSCSSVCPVKIDIHNQLLTLRADINRLHLTASSKRVAMRLSSWMMRRTWMYRAVGKLTRFVLRLTPRWLRYSRLNKWGIEREIPKPPKKSFRKMYSDHSRKK